MKRSSVCNVSGVVSDGPIPHFSAVRSKLPDACLWESNKLCVCVISTTVCGQAHTF